jgi:hypothetical protein
MEPRSPIDSSVKASLLTSASSLLNERAEHVARIAEIDSQLGAIETLTGEALAPRDQGGTPLAAAITARAAPAQPETWMDFIESLLSGINGGKTGKQLIAGIKASPEFSRRFARSPNSYYNALQRLEIQRRITKVGKVTYLMSTWENIQAGHIADETEEDKAGGMPAFITAVLQASPSSMAPAEIIAALREIPEALAKMESNKQIAYATLSRMAGLELIHKDGDGRYRIREDQLPPPSRTLSLLQGGASGVS